MPNSEIETDIPSEISPTVSAINANSLTVLNPQLLSLSLTESLFSNNCHNVTLIDLLSLETGLSSEDIGVIKTHNPYFTKGWLLDEIINSYLYFLTKD